MKKFFLALILVFSITTFLFAVNEKVCVFPNNDELKSMISSYTDLELCSFTGEIKTEDILTQDPMLLEYICNNAKSDYLLVPIIEKISDYNYFRLFIFDKATLICESLYERLDRESDRFSTDSILAISEYFNDSFLEDNTFSLIYSNHSLKLDCTNAIADIYLNDKYLGKTPLVVDSYTIPSIIKFCSEGFADRSFSVDDLKTNELVVTLIEDFKSDSVLFEKAQNKYYKSFALALLSWGSHIAVKSLNINNDALCKALDYASLGLALSSSVYLGININNYFKTTQNTTP